MTYPEPSDPTLEKPASPGAAPTVVAPLREGPGTKIGPYKLLQLIGEGGFGSVFMAEQTEPVRRRVALKIIKLGMDTRQVVARFEQERQALALMDHANIARVLDAGATDTGRPYFVMDLVKGEPVVEYCDKKNLTVHERLELFATVCAAVQHAHQKGIIHRDIKPSNILVSTQDDRPYPKIIDFGIAKAASSDLTDKTLYTEHRQLIGTPEYMSPEQAEGSLDIDTRTDVYSLGVVLYELLTGTTPFSGSDLRAAGQADIPRIIREVEPPKPSTRLRQSAHTLATVALRRHIEPHRLGAVLRGELDWIAMKAMEKDRQRRYDTAIGLAMDIRRYLAGEPVVAAPPSTPYRVRKFVRRHRAAVVAGALVAGALVLGIAGTTGGMVWALGQKARAENAERSAAAAEALASEQRDLAEDRLYESLLREARVIRSNRQVGYRRECFDRLQQAAAIATARRNLEVLRAEASRCLGDPIGLDPVEIPERWSGQPPGQEGAPAHAIDPRGTVVAHGAADGRLAVHDATTGGVETVLEDQGRIAKLAFDQSGLRLFGIVLGEDRGSNSGHAPAVVEWRRAAPGSWARHASQPIPGLSNFVASSRAVIRAAAVEPGRFDLTNAETGAKVGSVPLYPLALSADGRVAALRSTDAVGVILHDLESGESRPRLDPGLSHVKNAVFNDDGTFLACGCETGIVVIDVQRLEKSSVLRGYFERPSFLDRTTLLIPLPQEESVRLFNVATTSEVGRLGMGSWEVRVAAETRVVLSIGRTTQVIRLGGTPERRKLLGHAGGVPAVEFSPDGKQLASIGKDRTIRFWDAATGDPQKVWSDLDTPGQVVAYSPDGQYLVSAEWNRATAKLWSLATGRVVLTVGERDEGKTGTFSAGFSPTGRYLVMTGSAGLRVWELKSTGDAEGAPLRADEVCSIAGEVWAHQFDRSGELLCYVDSLEGQNGTYILRLRGETPVPQRVSERSTSIQSLGFASRESVFASFSGAQRAIELWDPESPRDRRSIQTLLPGERSTGGVGNLRFSPDGAMVAAVNGAGRGVSVIDAASGRRLLTLPDENGSVWWLAWSPDSAHLAVSRSEGDISVWDVSTARSLLAQAGLADEAGPGAAP